MVDTQSKFQWGAIGLLSLIVAALGGTVFLTPDQIDNAYICSVSKNIVIADHLSSTMKTAYWTESGLEKSKVCTNGQWLSLKQYAKDNNLDINVLLQDFNHESVGSQEIVGNKYRCDSQKCEVIQ